MKIALIIIGLIVLFVGYHIAFKSITYRAISYLIKKSEYEKLHGKSTAPKRDAKGRFVSSKHQKK